MELTKEQEKLVIDHLDYAKQVASAIVRNKGLHIELDDAEQVARMGLMQAAKKFDPARGFTFKTFSSRRIQGAIIDYVRADSFVGRRGITQKIKVQMDSLDTYWNDGELKIPLESPEMDIDLMMDLKDALAQLDKREQKIVLAIAYGTQAKDIADEFGISKSYVSQIYAKARKKLELSMA